MGSGGLLLADQFSLDITKAWLLSPWPGWLVTTTLKKAMGIFVGSSIFPLLLNVGSSSRQMVRL